jgi:hypothetical protein
MADSDRPSETIADILAIVTIFDKPHFSGHMSLTIRWRFSRRPFAWSSEIP